METIENLTVMFLSEPETFEHWQQAFEFATISVQFILQVLWIHVKK